MIQFQNLNVHACPTCREATVVDESVEITVTRSVCVGPKREIRKHTNGQRWETRTFLCGCVVAWSPNYSRAEVVLLCSEHPLLLAQAEAAEKRAAAQRLCDSQEADARCVEREQLEEAKRSIKL